MKAVYKYEYTVEFGDDEYEAIHAHWFAEVGQYYDHPLTEDHEIRREVVQWLISEAEVGNYTDIVHETGFEVVEESF